MNIPLRFIPQLLRTCSRFMLREIVDAGTDALRISGRAQLYWVGRAVGRNNCRIAFSSLAYRERTSPSLGAASLIYVPEARRRRNPVSTQK